MPGKIPRNPIAVGLFAYGLWQKLTPEQRRVLLAATRAHGPKVAAAAKAHGPKVAAAAVTAASQARRKR
jgi:hypothetical protein